MGNSHFARGVNRVVLDFSAYTMLGNHSVKVNTKLRIQNEY